jgi:hypothetical protein
LCLRLRALLAVFAITAVPASTSYLKNYKGTPYQDSRYHGGAQKIPGRVECSYYEGVDISYTKFHEQIDNSPYDLVQPGENQLYVGWTEPGEWFNLTVQVAHPAVYSVDLLYTSNRGGTISMDVKGKDATGLLSIASTFNASDPIAWR